MNYDVERALMMLGVITLLSAVATGLLVATVVHVTRFCRSDVEEDAQDAAPEEVRS